MKVFAAGIATETNTFSPIPTGYDDFHVARGRQGGTSGGADLEQLWGVPVRSRGHDFVFSLMARAQPSGTTVRSAYERLRDEMLADLRAAMPVDIVLLMLHGAMVAQGYDDCEEDMIRRVRDVVGRDAVIGVELDLHCHLSEATIAPADLVITYKEYPHTDRNDRAAELLDLAIDTKLGKIRPAMALFDCRMIGMYPTSRQPLRGFVEAMQAAERKDRVLSISFGHGFQFADVPHVGAKVIAITDDDAALASRVAREFGERVHALRREIGFESLSLPMEEALSRALAAKRGPVVVADQSDNTGAGAPGDATFALRWLVGHEARDAALAIVYDPEVVRIARSAGAGAQVAVRLGGKLGPTSGDPVDVEATVLATRDNYMQAFPQLSGEPSYYPVGNMAALRIGGVDVVVGSERCQCFSPAVFTDIGIDPKQKRVLVVKSTQHFYGAFAPLAAEVIYMSAPGATPPDPKRLAYRRFDTADRYPWVDEPRLRT